MVLYLFAVALSFLVSSTIGLGGSLVAVPAMVACFGAKGGIALAALLLASNNLFKIIAYRRTIPWKGSFILSALTILGTFVGARLLLSLPDVWVIIAVLSSLIWSLGVEIHSYISPFGKPSLSAQKPWIAGLYALIAGLTSGVSGTSGPLKGIAIRHFTSDREHYAGAASLISFVGDATKVAVFAEAALLGNQELKFLLLVIPLMPLCAFGGRWLNWKMGERWFTYAFWAVIAGYSLRLAAHLW